MIEGFLFELQRSKILVVENIINDTNKTQRGNRLVEIYLENFRSIISLLMKVITTFLQKNVSL